MAGRGGGGRGPLHGTLTHMWVALAGLNAGSVMTDVPRFLRTWV